MNARAPSRGTLVRRKASKVPILDCIIPVRPEPDEGLTPLHLALTKGRMEMAELLADAGANVDAKDTSGWTLCHWAAANCKSETIHWLLVHEANLNVEDKEGCRPLHYATEFNCDETADLLRRLGAQE